MSDIIQRRADRAALLTAIYDKTNGREFTMVEYQPLGEPLGLDPRETVETARFLQQQGLVKLQHVLASLTHDGINAVEEMRMQAQKSRGLQASDLQLGDRLGRGGFGEVYKYTHPFLQLEFAVKLFAPAFGEVDESHLERFFREARILFALNHPNIIRVFDVGIFEARPFIRMEFFPGVTLAQKLKDEGRVEPIYARRVISQIAEGLEHAHAASVLHRDLKPSNVMVLGPNAEEVRILDFGLGVFVETDIASRLTKTGQAVLGGYYTAPELEATPKLLEPHVDIYSAGAIWFTLLTGRAPAGTNIEEALDYEVKLQPAEREVLLRCLRNAPKRFQTASDLLAALRTVDQQEPPKAPVSAVDIGQVIRDLSQTPGTETYKLFQRLEDAKRNLVAKSTAERLRRKPWRDPDIKLCPYCSSSFSEEYPGQPCPACGKASK